MDLRLKPLTFQVRLVAIRPITILDNKLLLVIVTVSLENSTVTA